MEGLERMTNVFVLIPCYNVEDFCGDVLEQTILCFKNIVLIDDGSTDNTSHTLKEFQQTYPSRIHLIQHHHNMGKGTALLTALRYALSQGASAIVTLDGDGQHRPDQGTLLLQALEQGADLVIGSRSFALMPFRSKWANRSITFFLHRLYANAPEDTQTGFRAFSPRFTQRILGALQNGRYETEFYILLLALSEKYVIREVAIETIYLDKNRSSHFSRLKDSLRILKALWQHFRQPPFPNQDTL
jgi:glycosyltransferase involved in cell wall biosynthesis